MLAGLLAATGGTALGLWLLPSSSRAHLVWSLVFAAGIVRACLFAVSPSADALSRHPDSGGEVCIWVEVVSEPDPRVRDTRYILDLQAVDYGDSSRVRTGQLLARFTHDPRFVFGEHVHLRGRWRQADGARNPGDFDYAAFLRRRGIDALWVPAIRGAVLARTSPEEFSWVGDVVAPVRQWTGRRFASHLSGEPLALVFGLLFGEKAGMERMTVEAFEITGTLHLLAVSGSNVAVVVGVVWGLLTFLRIRGLLRSACCLFAILLFCDLAHNEPSVVRASVAAALVIVGRLCGRVPDALNIWGGSLLLLLMWDPRQLQDVGFQLSYLATLGILLFYPPVRQAWMPGARWVRPVRTIVLAGWVSVAAQLTTLPVLAEVFHRVPLVTPVSNLLCVPVAGLVTAAGSAAVLAAPASDWLFSLLCAITWLFARALLWTVQFFAGWSAPVWNPGFGFWAWMVYGTGLALAYCGFVHPRLRRRVLLLTFVLLCAVSWGSVWSNGTGPNILVIDHDRRSTSLVRWPGGSTWWVAPRGDYVDDRSRSKVQDVITRLNWPMPEQVWLLEDGTSSPGEHGGGAWLPSPVVSVPSRSPEVETAWVVRVQSAGKGLDLARLEMVGPAGRVIWLSHGGQLGQIRLAAPGYIVTLVPDLAALPAGSGPLPAGVQVVETGAAPLPAACAVPMTAQILRTRDVGAIVIRCLPREIRSEASMR